MIVKTGANYQEEGGYIEASAKGDVYTITKDDKSAVFGGLTETGPFVTPITIINETGRTLLPTCFFSLGGLGEVLGTPLTVMVGADETKTINCVGLLGIKQRLSYSGSEARIKCDSEYVVVENSGVYAAFSIFKFPENGEPITMRMYI